jgi:hypothetical protein
MVMNFSGKKEKFEWNKLAACMIDRKSADDHPTKTIKERAPSPWSHGP